MNDRLNPRFWSYFWDPKLDRQEQLLSELSKDDGGLDVAKFGVSV